MKEESHYIPKRLQQNKILFWDVSEFGVFMGCVLIGAAFENFLLFLLIGILFSRFIKKMSGKGKGNMLLFWIYWNLPPKFSSFKKTPPSHKRYFKG